MLTEIIKPSPDSHYRLVPCECGGVPVYERHWYESLKTEFWKVKCPDCGCHTFECNIRHDAQLEWNTARKEGL